jgi:hypothetical protein
MNRRPTNRARRRQIEPSTADREPPTPDRGPALSLPLCRGAPRALPLQLRVGLGRNDREGGSRGGEGRHRDVGRRAGSWTNDMRERREIPKIEGGEAGVLILGKG